MPPICFYCGDAEDLLDNDNDVMANLRKEFAVVRPICKTCYNSGLLPKTRNALKVGQSKKKKR